MADSRAPELALPPGACDAHCHVFGPQAVFPYAEGRTFTPPESPKERLRALHRTLGLERAVIVQSSCHGSDHAALLDALAAGAGAYRGVALVTAATSDAELRHLHAAGVRGARIHFAPHLGPPPSTADVEGLVERIRPYRWHLAVHVMGDALVRLSGLLRALPVRVVVDHLARADPAGGPVADALLDLLGLGHVWVKLSGADRIAAAPPQLDDAAAFAARLAAAAPERVVWGTDFPHPNSTFTPDDADLVDLLRLIAPDEAARHRLLVGNPTECFFRD